MQTLPLALRRFAVLIIIGLSAVAHGRSWASIQIIPSAPRYLEPVYLRVTGSAEPIVDAHVSMVSGTLVVNYDTILFLGPPPVNGYGLDVSLGRFPAGTYTVKANILGAALTAEFTVSPKAPTPWAVAPPLVDFTGMWWNPQQSGWGISIFQGPTNDLFAVWFVYDASGAPIWYTLQPGAWDNSQVFSGPIYRTSGPYFGGPFDLSQVKIQQVGSGVLRFSDSSHANFQYTISGQPMLNKDIERQPIE